MLGSRHKEGVRVSFDPFIGVYGPRACLGHKLLNSCDSLCFLGFKHFRVLVLIYV